MSRVSENIPIYQNHEFSYCGWVPCVSGHLDFRLMTVGLSGNYLPTIRNEGLIEFIFGKLNNTPERQPHQDTKVDSINYSKTPPRDKHTRRVVLQSWVNWRDMKVDAYGEFRVIVIAECNESLDLENRCIQGHVCIFPRYFTDENHPENTQDQKNASKKLFDLIGTLRETHSKRKKFGNSITPELIANTKELNSIWVNLYNEMLTGAPLGKGPSINHVYLIKFKVLSNGLTFLELLTDKSRNLESDFDDEQKYLICRQAYYYLKYSLHKHKHHHFEADALTTIIPYDENQTEHIGLQLLNQLKRELIRIKRMQTIGVIGSNRNHDALGIIGYAKSLVASCYYSNLMSQTTHDKELEYLSGFEQSFKAQNDVGVIKKQTKAAAEQYSRQIIALSLAYLSINILLLINLFRPGLDENPNNVPYIIEFLRDRNGIEFSLLSILGLVFIWMIMKIVVFFRSKENYPQFLYFVRNRISFVNKILGVPLVGLVIYLVYRIYQISSNIISMLS